MRTRTQHGHPRRHSRAAIRALSATGAAVLVTGGIAFTGPAAFAGAPVNFTTPGEHVYVVPDGVTQLRIDAVGGEGADGAGGAGGGEGGSGGQVSAYYDTTPGTTIYIEVGANGSGASTGGGGMSGGFDGGRGGGASDVRLCSIDDCKTFDFRILVAGGGGGGGAAGTNGQDGGDGGDAGQSGAQGEAPTPAVTRAGGGGSGGVTSNAGGTGSALTCEPGFAGQAGGVGRNVAGAPGGSAPSIPGGAGGAAFGGGGGGGAGLSGAGAGGGGGAGYIGGGGGGGGGFSTCRDDASGGGGGGGGTNYIDSDLRVISNGLGTGAPRVTITALDPQTIEFTSSAPSAVIGGTYVPTAEATSGLPVALTIDPASAAFCEIAAGVVTFLSPGACVINANQAGNDGWSPAQQVQQSVTVGTPSPPVIDVVTPPQLTITKPVDIDLTSSGYPTPTLSVVGSLPTGVTFDNDGDGTGALIGTPAAGTAGDYPVTIRAQNRSGTAEQQLLLVVVRVPSAVELSLPGTSTQGQSVLIGIEVTGGDPPSGDVELTSGGVVLGVVTLDASGKGDLTTNTLAVGTQSIVARYAGDPTFAPSTGAATIVVAASSTNGGLAFTGAESMGLFVASLVLLAGGGVVLLVMRWRRRV